MIPKLLHFIWVGDESKRPDNCIDTWRAHHPDWTVMVWGNKELNELKWHNRAHMAAMYERELNGVADLMRWEILYANGGIVMDADSICVRPLDEHLLDCEAFACWESEVARPGLIAAGYFGSVAGTAFLKQIVRDIADEPSVTHDVAWKTVGPVLLTESYRKYNYSALRIYPSHYFIPQHFTGVKYEGDGPVYAHQLWGSTRGAYDEIFEKDTSVIIDTAPALLAQSAAPQPPSAPAPATVSAPAQPFTGLATRHGGKPVQKVAISNELAGIDRIDALRAMCQGKRVLHVGCGEWPVASPADSLHLALQPVCAALDGVDGRAEAIERLAPFATGRLFGSLAEATESYDVVLVPQVLEQVAGVEEFLGALQTIDATMFLITAPDAFQCREAAFEYHAESETFVEVAHAEHSTWYTPFTFANTIRKYSALKLERMWFFDGRSLLALLSKQTVAAGIGIAA